MEFFKSETLFHPPNQEILKNRTDDIVRTYKELAVIPSLTSARISAGLNNSFKIQTVWSERNLEQKARKKFIKDFIFTSALKDKKFIEGFPLDATNELLRTTSEDESLQAILRVIVEDTKLKQYIEIWDKTTLIKSYDLSAFDEHGEVYVDPVFSSFQISRDNTKLLYIAEMKGPKCVPFSKAKPKNTTEGQVFPGMEYTYKPDWGEQLRGKHRSVVVVLDFTNDTITPCHGIPPKYFPAQVTWVPNGDGIAGVVYKLYRRYLGLKFCTNRESYIFRLSANDEFSILSDELCVNCRSPRFSPNGQYLAWLERDLTAPHHTVQRINYVTWGISPKPKILVEAVPEDVSIDEKESYYGVYTQILPERCWSDNSKYLFFSTPQKFNIHTYAVNVVTKVIFVLHNLDKTSLSVLDVKENMIAFCRSSVLKPPHLVIGQINLTKPNNLSVCFFDFLEPINIPRIKDLMLDQYEHEYIETNPEALSFNFTYLGKSSGPNRSMPGILIPHGEPHAAFSNEYNLHHVFFASLGYAVFLINYRGSIGAGGNSVEYLLGRIGVIDVMDCITTVNIIETKYSWIDPQRLNLHGGSHGGYLCAQLSGLLPETFRAVSMRNPNIDLYSKFLTSDIPDWCLAECRIDTLKVPEFIPANKFSEFMKTFLKVSPITYSDKVITPTFVAVGTEDLRCPPFQGILWYHRLQHRKISSMLRVYNDNHSLAKVEVEADFIINTALWFALYDTKFNVKI